MFKAPFSFTGRIRRLELGLTYIFYFVCLGVISLLSAINDFIDSIITLFYLISYWIVLAQGSKRCHDLDNSGFFQLIPFYFFVMIFQEGNPNENRYGLNPKSTGFLEANKKMSLFKIRKLSKQSFLEIMVMTLFSALILSFNNMIFEGNENYIIISYFVMPIPSFLAFQYMSYSKLNDGIDKSYRISQQLYFSAIYFFVIKTYTVNARGADFSMDTVFNDLTAIGLIMGSTFISVGLFNLLSTTKNKNV